MKPREIRQAARVSQIQAAVRTGTSEPTVRLYEASRDAVADPVKRAALDAFYAALADSIAEDESGGPAAA